MNELIRYLLILGAVTLLVLLFDITIGQIMDRYYRQQERIRTEAEKRMNEILEGKL
jgi:hypothetical protein